MGIESGSTDQKVYAFPLKAQGARKRLFFEGPAGEAAHENLCRAARDLREMSENGLSMPLLSSEAIRLLGESGFSPVPH
jgi:hypothetical protein